VVLLDLVVHIFKYVILKVVDGCSSFVALVFYLACNISRCFLS